MVPAIRKNLIFVAMNSVTLKYIKINMLYITAHFYIHMVMLKHIWEAVPIDRDSVSED